MVLTRGKNDRYGYRPVALEWDLWLDPTAPWDLGRATVDHGSPLALVKQACDRFMTAPFLKRTSLRTVLYFAHGMPSEVSTVVTIRNAVVSWRLNKVSLSSSRQYKPAFAPADKTGLPCCRSCCCAGPNLHSDSGRDSTVPCRRRCCVACRCAARSSGGGRGRRTFHARASRRSPGSTPSAARSTSASTGTPTGRCTCTARRRTLTGAYSDQPAYSCLASIIRCVRCQLLCGRPS